MNDPTLKEKLSSLPKNAQPIIDEMHSGKSLGASRNIRQINDLFCAIADGWETSSSEELVKAIMNTGDYFIENRSKNTPAIGNAINMVLKDLDKNKWDSINQVKDFVFNRSAEYNKRSLENIQKISSYGANLFTNCDVILPFDYSSSQVAIIKELGDRDCPKRLIVTESRDLDGGRPIIQEATEWGHSANFVLDVAFHHFMRDVDAVLYGAETIFADGSCWNTVGCYPVAVVAKEFNVPVYVATELIKIDSRSFRGIQKKMKLDDYSKILDYPGTFNHPDKISVTAPALDNVPPSMITGYITEQGVMPPEMIWQASLNFLRENGTDPLM